MTHYNADADINRDGAVDAADKALCVAMQGKTPLGGPEALNPKSWNAGLISDAGGPRNNVGYAGCIFASETRFYVMHFRWFGPMTGRWLERDPAGNVDGMNLYQYASGMPLLRVDPTGLFGDDCGDAGIWDYVKAVTLGFFEGAADGLIDEVTGAGEAVGQFVLMGVAAENGSTSAAFGGADRSKEGWAGRGWRGTGVPWAGVAGQVWSAWGCRPINCEGPTPAGDRRARPRSQNPPFAAPTLVAESALRTWPQRNRARPRGENQPSPATGGISTRAAMHLTVRPPRLREESCPGTTIPATPRTSRRRVARKAL